MLFQSQCHRRSPKRLHDAIATDRGARAHIHSGAAPRRSGTSPGPVSEGVSAIPSKSPHFSHFPRHFLPALSSSEEQLPVPSRSDASSVHAAPTHRRRSGRAARRQPMGTSLHERRHRRRLPASPPPALRPPKRLALPRTRNQRHRGFVVDSSRNSRQHWRKLSSL